ncbi:MAG: TonB-dependent receptor [Myxococcota bacterium]
MNSIVPARQLRPDVPRSWAVFLASLLLISATASSPIAAEEDERDATILLAQADASVDDEVEDDDSSGPPEGVQIMRVRGRGIDAIETEVPSSLTQFNAADIEALGAQNISDLSRVTPNVNIIQPGATQSIFFIRGVGLSDFSANATGAVAVFQDRVAINAAAIQTGQLYDIGDIQALRGPQGTGAYRNASAGAIAVTSRRPTGSYAANLRATFGRRAADGGKGALHAFLQDYEGAIEMPIVEDWFSGRFAFRLRDSDPYKTNGCGNAPPFGSRLARNPPAVLPADASICGELSQDLIPNPNPGAGVLGISLIPVGLNRRVQFEHNWAARGTWAITPPEMETKIFFNLHGSRLNQDNVYGQAIGFGRIQGFPGGDRVFGGITDDGYQDRDLIPQIEAVCDRNAALACQNPFAQALLETSLTQRPLDARPFRGDYNRDGRVTRDAYGGFFEIESKIADLDVSLLTSWDQYRRFTRGDNDFTPEIFFEIDEDDKAWQTYQEVKVGGELAREPFEWEIGGFYLQESLDVLANTAAGIDAGTIRDYSQRIWSTGVWGSFAWDFLDELTLEGGVRFNYERKTFRFDRSLAFGGGIRPQDAIDQEEVWQTPTGKIQLRYHLYENASIYAQYNRGFKAGHFNALNTGETQDPAEDEFVDAWEVGFSGRFLDQRLQMSGAFFYYRYQDYQLFLFSNAANGGPVLEIVNASQAENFGAELEMRLKPLEGWAPRIIEGLEITGNASWLHGEFIDFQIQREARLAGFVVSFVQDFSGDQLQNAPEWKVSGNASWEFDLGKYGYLIPFYQFSYQDDIFYGVNEGEGNIDFDGTSLLPRHAIGQKAFWLHDLRLTYRTPGGSIEVAGWVRNVTDEVYKNFAFDASVVSRVIINFVGEPRTIGVDVTVNF